MVTDHEVAWDFPSFIEISVNVLKFRTLRPIPFFAQILLFIQLFLKILSGIERQTV